MIVTTKLVTNLQAIGTSVTIADDKTWARLCIHVEQMSADPVIINGTPRELRALANAILDGCKRSDRRNLFEQYGKV